MNQIIAQNYWTSKADVESVVFSCYTGLTSSDVITRMIIWGEVRSDNIKEGQQITQASKDLQYLLNGNILETNTYCDFSAFYKLINRCNTVELYAPVIQERDPNYTESDLRQNLAEVKAIRALCYFYLIRTYGDVPFTFVASIDDDQNYYLPATKQELILDTLIMDLEANVNYAPKRYAELVTSAGDYTCARITRNAINAMLADMYLWRASNANVAPATRNADYLKCVEYCDKVIDAKIAEYKEDSYGNLKPQVSKDIYAKYGFPLLEEWAESDQTSGQGTNAKAFNRIFGGDGNSFESIFELNFEEESHQYGSSNENSAIGSLYGGRNSSESGAQLAANDIMMSTTPDANYESNGNLFSSYDFRSQTSFLYHDSDPYTIQKYVLERARVSVGAKNVWKVDNLNNSARQENYANWILYRLTDIMLMKAEAEVQIAAYLDENAAASTGDGTTTPAPRRIVPTGNVYSTAKEYYDDAFNIVIAIYERSAPQAIASAKPQRSNFNIKKDFDLLVENERRRELLFEGKRYYDLVRRARRDGSTAYVSGLLSSKFTQNSSAMRIKMAMIEFLYMPFSEDELKRNPLLTQNPAFDKEKKNKINY